MITLSQPHIIRSLGYAAILSLYDLDPETNFDQIPALPTENDRIYYEYKEQRLPLTYGFFGIFLVPGLVIEYGGAPNDRGNVSTPVIVSLARMIEDTSHEREQDNLAELGAKLYNLIFVRKQCPTYAFSPDDSPAVGIVSAIDWHNERLGTPDPRTAWSGNLSGDGERWLRVEYHFTIFYRMQKVGI